MLRRDDQTETQEQTLVANKRGRGRRRGKGRAGGFIGCFRRVVPTTDGLGYSLVGLERRGLEHRRWRALMPTRRNSPAEYATRRRIGVQPGVGGERIRQCTAAGGAPVVQIPEAIEYEARLEGVPLPRNWWCITRALVVEGHIRLGIWNMVLPAREDNCMK